MPQKYPFTSWTINSRGELRRIELVRPHGCGTRHETADGRPYFNYQLHWTKKGAIKEGLKRIEAHLKLLAKQQESMKAAAAALKKLGAEAGIDFPENPA